MLAKLTQDFIIYLNEISKTIALPWFTFFGSIIEEIVAPIPSPVVMTLAGTIAASQNQSWLYLLLLSIMGSIGKTVASCVMYFIADKSEDLVLGKFGRFIGINHQQIESIGKHLNKGKRDYIAIFLLRAIPIIPTAPVSIIGGLVKINIKTYIISTFLGTIVRNLFYLGVGYTGINATGSLITQIEDFEIIGYIGIIIGSLMALGYIYYQRYKGSLLHKLFYKGEIPKDS